MAIPNSTNLSHKEQIKPRHPYAFCQCEISDCVECRLEEKERLRTAIIEAAATRRQIWSLFQLHNQTPRRIFNSSHLAAIALDQ